MPVVVVRAHEAAAHCPGGPMPHTAEICEPRRMRVQQEQALDQQAGRNLGWWGVLGPWNEREPLTLKSTDDE